MSAGPTVIIAVVSTVYTILTGGVAMTSGYRWIVITGFLVALAVIIALILLTPATEVDLT
jgi:uncharacterized membrane protein